MCMKYKCVTLLVKNVQLGIDYWKIWCRNRYYWNLIIIDLKKHVQTKQLKKQQKTDLKTNAFLHSSHNIKKIDWFSNRN